MYLRASPKQLRRRRSCFLNSFEPSPIKRYLSVPRERWCGGFNLAISVLVSLRRRLMADICVLLRLSWGLLLLLLLLFLLTCCITWGLCSKAKAPGLDLGTGPSRELRGPNNSNKYCDSNCILIPGAKRKKQEHQVPDKDCNSQY
jgi:hypothetical protein